jgi:hypothetical protein
MHPIITTPVAEAFPTLCCCFKMCKGANEMGEMSQEETDALIKDIKEQDMRLDTVISFYKAGKYEGTNFQKEKMK